MAFVKSGDQQLEYFACGDDTPTVVLIHGAGSSARIWHTTQHLLAAAGYPSVAISLPGAGASDRAEALDGYQPLAYAKAARGAIDALGVTRCTLFGHSLGVSNVLYLVTEFSEGLDIDAMIMLAGGSGDRRDAPGEEEKTAIIRSMMATSPRSGLARDDWEVLHKGLNPTVQDALWADIKANPPERATGQRISGRKDMTPFLNATDIQTLVMSGDHDSVVPLSATLGMYHKLRPEVAHLHVMHGVDHYPNAEVPDAMTSACVHFLDKYTGS